VDALHGHRILQRWTAVDIYRRARDRGHQLPPGLEYVDSCTSNTLGAFSSCVLMIGRCSTFGFRLERPRSFRLSRAHVC